MKFTMLLSLFLLVCGPCLAGSRYLYPVPTEGQRPLLNKGDVGLSSPGRSQVVLQGLRSTLKRGEGRFSFVITNGCGEPIDFFTSNLCVTDQWGRPVKVVRKDELLSGARTERRSDQIERRYSGIEQRIHDHYFETTTLFPGQQYGACFKIEVPHEIERTLQTLVFHFDVGGERHTFFYDCHRKKGLFQ